MQWMATQAKKRRWIPAYILTGFLGSGKTTLLGALIEWSLGQGLKPGLIINEFGDVSIDGEAVRQEGLALTELSSGCICCTANEELITTLPQLAGRDDIDLILVEATGLADPADMLDELTDPSLWERLEVGGTISVLDSKRVIELADEVGLVRRQIQYADVLVMNKCDLIDGEWRAALREWLPRLAPNARIFTAEHGIPYEGLEALLTHSLARGRLRFEHDRQEQADHTHHEHEYDHTHEHHHDHVHGAAHASLHTCSFPLDQPLDRRRFEQFLEQLPRTIYRAKGFVTLQGSDEPFVFQYVPGFVFLRPFPLSNRAMLRGVFIGQYLDKQELAAGLRACQHVEMAS